MTSRLQNVFPLTCIIGSYVSCCPGDLKRNAHLQNRGITMEGNYRLADSLPQHITCLRNHWLEREVNSQLPLMIKCGTRRYLL